MKKVYISYLVCWLLFSSNLYSQTGSWSGYMTQNNNVWLVTLQINHLTDNGTFVANSTISREDGGDVAKYIADGMVTFNNGGYSISYVDTLQSGPCCWTNSRGMYGVSQIASEGVVIDGEWRWVDLSGSKGGDFKLVLQGNMLQPFTQPSCSIRSSCDFPGSQINISQFSQLDYEFNLVPQNFSSLSISNNKLFIISFNGSTFDFIFRVQPLTDCTNEHSLQISVDCNKNNNSIDFIGNTAECRINPCTSSIMAPSSTMAPPSPTASILFAIAITTIWVNFRCAYLDSF